MEPLTIVSIGLNLIPPLVRVGKDIWDRLTALESIEPLEDISIGKSPNGVLDRTYYSADYMFTISVPNDDWKLRKPSSRFKETQIKNYASSASSAQLRSLDMPVVILSNKKMEGYRPNIVVTTMKTSDRYKIDEFMQIQYQMLSFEGLQIKDEDFHVSPTTNSGLIIGTYEYNGKTFHCVVVSYLHLRRLYVITSAIIPISHKKSPFLEDILEIINSFKLIHKV